MIQPPFSVEEQGRKGEVSITIDQTPLSRSPAFFLLLLPLLLLLRSLLLLPVAFGLRAPGPEAIVIAFIIVIIIKIESLQDASPSR